MIAAEGWKGAFEMWNPVDPAIVEEPRPFWAWLRREAPVWEVPGAGYFVVSRYDDVTQVSRDSDSYSSELKGVVQRDADGRARLMQTDLVGQPQARVLGVADGDVHARHRRMVGRAFSPSRMERLSHVAREIARRCVGDIEDATTVDVVEALAIPLPLEFTIRLLGLPLEDRRALQDFTDHALRMNGGLASAQEQAESLAETMRFHAYLETRFAEALTSPDDDLIGDLARAVHERARGEEGLEHWEAIAILFQLVVGGIETTVGLIAEVVRHAVQQPAAWTRLREDPTTLPAFIEECLRLDGPAIGNLRRTTRETQLGGRTLPEGATVALLWGSANRDEAQFTAGDRFLLDRPNIKTHLGFGLGKHFCLGAALARMEARIALETLLARSPELELACETSELRHRPSMGIRRLESLPMRIRGAARTFAPSPHTGRAR
jgi:cytochrome P450